MSHQVSQHKAGEGILLHLELTRTAAPFPLLLQESTLKTDLLMYFPCKIMMWFPVIFTAIYP